MCGVDEHGPGPSAHLTIKRKRHVHTCRRLCAGKELAKQFAAKGARLILSSRRREVLLAVRSDIVAASRGAVQDEDIKIVTLDLEHVDSMRDCTRAAIASFGKVPPHPRPARPMLAPAAAFLARNAPALVARPATLPVLNM